MLIISHHDCRPEVSPGVFLAPNATVIGEVSIGEGSSLWFNTVVRADINSVTIGRRTNLQDGVVVHVAQGVHSTYIGDDVTVGHNAVLHGCRVGDGCLVGMQATVLDGAVIGESSLIAAGSVVAPGTVVPPGSFVVGAPASVRRTLSESERDDLKASAARYVTYTQDYLPVSASSCYGESE